ncbi:DUF6893 family small protein [Amycolatopsis sp. NPDC051903]
MFKKLLLLLVLAGGVAFVARQVKPDVQRYVDMSRK